MSITDFAKQDQSIVRFENLTQVGKPHNCVFKLENEAIEETILIFRNGVLQEPDEDGDYIIENGLIIFLTKVDSDEKLQAFYSKK